MTKLRLFVALLLTATCCSAQAQSHAADRHESQRFPGGLPVHPANFDVSGPLFDPQVGASIIDGSGSSGHLEVFDAEVLPADCGYSCPAAWTAEIEGFYMNREGDDRFTASSAFVVDDFGYETGIRTTLHRHLDCLEGWDITYAGGFDWSDRNQRTGAGLNALFAAGGGVNISAFNNATVHTQSLRSQLHSLEVNRKWYGWDVLAVGVGLRYLNVEEDFLFRSVDGGGNSGSLGIETNNNAGGPQLLLEMKIPIGNWTSTTRIKGGLMANIADSNTALINAGAVEIANSDDDLQFASLIEFGYFVKYRLTPNVSLQGGYEFWWLYGLAVAPDQLQARMTPRSGLNIDTNGDTWYHGGTFGVEVVY